MNSSEEKAEEIYNQATVITVCMWNQLLQSGRSLRNESLGGPMHALPLTQWCNIVVIAVYPRAGLETKTMVPVIKVLWPLDLAGIQTFKIAPGSLKEFPGRSGLPSPLSEVLNL